MTRPSAPYRIPDPAPPRERLQVPPGREGAQVPPGREGAQVPPGRVPELCTRCGAIGTHYLTCPSLRLPSGYRLGPSRAAS